MKRRISLLLGFAMLLSLLPACRPRAEEPEPPASTAPAEPELSCADILYGVWNRLGAGLKKSAEVYGAGKGEAEDGGDPGRPAAYVRGAYGLEDGEWEDAAIARETGASAVEMAVLRFAGEAAASHGYDCLKGYLHGREGDFTGYAPAQAALVADAALVREGLYVGLFIVEDSAYAGQVFADMVETGELPEPTEAPEPMEAPEPEQDDFVPPFEIRDLLHRILLEAACPEWGDLDEKGWTMNGSKGAIAFWEPNGGGEAPGGIDQTAVSKGLFPVLGYTVQVYQMESEEAAKEEAVFLNLLLKDQENQYRQLGSEARAELLANGRTVSSGHYAALIVSDHVEEAVQLFPYAVRAADTRGYFERCYINKNRTTGTPDPDYPGRVQFTPPNEDDMSIYDTSAIRAAWEKGDPAGLSGADEAVYNAAKAVLGGTIRDGMTGLEKETAIYAWVVDNVDYDWTYQDVMAETSRTSYQPYGGLVERTAVCLGYATSFQLLCDLAGVECITVVGAAFNSTGDHAWNMVRLNGEWYCVDAAWDANGRELLGGEYAWRYFNVTSAEMAENHQWDYANTPEATAEDRGLF